ncbi:hypothetical protein [Sphingopyxis flava]|uniref:Major Facilitator Superfamily protein n=1 Tax=Sphingopyxis flava TaxID=1507287 RepID=A0A1T5GJN7_9SPHN|nr:hypothetical protein [Sphingopyxis flava]SKC08599.1 hypothetical protein SAMN06295937_10812 [Sphingopyxis flava]
MASGYSLTHWTGSLFIRPWEEEFGWSRGEIAFAHNGAIAAALISPFAGAFLDRAGVRRPVIIAFAVMGLAYLAMTQQSGGLSQLYATYLVIQVAGIFTTGLVFTRVVATRFSASRGLALVIWN